MLSRDLSVYRILCVACVAITFSAAEAMLGQEALLTRGPYLQVCTSTSIVVRWRTDVPADSVVRCGTVLTNLDRVFVDATATTEHQVTVTNLQPQTKYFYAISTSESDLASVDERLVAGGSDNYFITAPPTGVARPTRIWFISDYGFANEGEIAVRDSYFNFTAASRPADVWLTGGDNDQRHGADYQAQESIFEIYAPLLRKLAVWPTLGNHDSYTASFPGPYPFFENFSFPLNGEAGGAPSGSKHYYSFDYGDIHFICMDSITAEMSSSTNTAMFQWLREDLSQTTARWKIAYWHGPPYTKGSHDSDNPADNSARMVNMRRHALPILESHGVDLVLCGHSHVYERSALLNGHYGYSWTLNQTNRVDSGDGREDGSGAYRQRMGHGTVYVVAAVGGFPFGFYYGQHPAHVMNIGLELGSCVIDINGDRLDFKFINSETNVLDYFTLFKEQPLRIAHLNRPADKVALSWNSKPGRYYRIFGMKRLGDGWALVADRIPSQGEKTTWTGTWEPGSNAGYFMISTSE